MAKANEPSPIDKRIADLEAKIARTEEEAYLRAKYGAVTEEHLIFYRGVEAAEVAQKEQRAEQERRRYAETKLRNAAMRKLAGDLAVSGRLRLYVDGKPTRLGAGLLVGCPVCGADAPTFTNRIWDGMDRWLPIGHSHPRINDPALWDSQIWTLYLEPRRSPVKDEVLACDKCGARSRITLILVPDPDAPIKAVE